MQDSVFRWLLTLRDWRTCEEDLDGVMAGNETRPGWILIAAVVVLISMLAIVRVGLVQIVDLLDGCFDGRFVDATVSFGQVDRLAPVMRPVELAAGQRRVRRAFSAHPGTKY